MPAETAKEYIQRILAQQAGKDPWKILASTPTRIDRLVRGCSKHKLQRHPAPGKWSVGEILAHLAEAEWVIGYRARLILGEPGTKIQAYDQDEWARLGDYARRDPAASLELFRALRKANLGFWKSLRPAQWKLHGIHAERGLETLERIWRHNAGHDLNHLKQIEAMLKQGKLR